MCATVFYRKHVNGKLYPKAARTGPCAFAQDVRRVDGSVVTRYIGIVRLPEGVDVVESKEEGEHGHPTGEPQEVQQRLQ